jgi:hypothetical protein
MPAIIKFGCPRRFVVSDLLRDFEFAAVLQIWRPGKNGGYPNFASDVSCVPGCRGDSVARHSSFKTWSRLGVGDRLRGTHLDQDQVSLSSQLPVSYRLNANSQFSFKRYYVGSCDSADFADEMSLAPLVYLI